MEVSKGQQITPGYEKYQEGSKGLANMSVWIMRGRSIGPPQKSIWQNHKITFCQKKQIITISFSIPGGVGGGLLRVLQVYSCPGLIWANKEGGVEGLLRTVFKGSPKKHSRKICLTVFLVPQLQPYGVIQLCTLLVNMFMFICLSQHVILSSAIGIECVHMFKYEHQGTITWII